jgi:hypothetical protein
MTFGHPSAIQAPGSLTPPSSDPGSITPPASSKPQAQSQSFSSGTTLNLNTTVSSQPVSTPSVGVQSFSVSSATTTASSQPATTASSGQPSQFSSQINLEAPSSVLPPSITPLSASSISAPSSFTVVTPNAGDVSSITAPNSSSVPTVGTTPSSGPSAITPPGNGSVVPPGGSSGGIVPPGGVSGSSGGSVKPLDYYYDGYGKCAYYPYSSQIFDSKKCDPSSTLEERANQAKREAEAATDPGVRDARLTDYWRIQAQLVARDAFGSDALADDYVRRLGQSQFYKALDGPGEQLLTWKGLAIALEGATNSQVARLGFEELLRFFERNTPTRDASGKIIGFSIGAGAAGLARPSPGGGIDWGRIGEGAAKGLRDFFGVIGRYGGAALRIAGTAAITSSLTGDSAKGNCQSQVSEGIFQTLQTQAVGVRSNPAVVGGVVPVSPGATVATSIYNINGTVGNAVGISGRNDNLYPIAIQQPKPVPGQGYLVSDNFRLSGRNFWHAEAKILESLAQDFQAQPQDAFGAVYIYIDSTKAESPFVCVECQATADRYRIMFPGVMVCIKDNRGNFY